MPLPISITGTVSMETTSDPLTVADRLEHGLQSLRAEQITRDGTTLGFKAGVFRLVMSYNLLASISAGYIMVQPSHAGVRVTYRLEFVQMLVVVTVMVLGFFGPFVLLFNSSFGDAALTLAFLWIWMLGGNIVIALVRFPRWVRRCVAG